MNFSSGQFSAWPRENDRENDQSCVPASPPPGARGDLPALACPPALPTCLRQCVPGTRDSQADVGQCIWCSGCGSTRHQMAPSLQQGLCLRLLLSWRKKLTGEVGLEICPRGFNSLCRTLDYKGMKQDSGLHAGQCPISM